MRNVMRRPLRSALSVAGVAIGVAAGTAMAAVAWGFEASWTRGYEARGTDLVVARMTGRNPMPAPFDEEKLTGIRQLRGIGETAGLITGLLRLKGGASLAVHGIEGGSFPWDNLVWREGGPPEGDGICLGALAAESLAKRVGDSVNLEDRDLPVAGIYESRAIVESGAAMTTLATMQKLLGWEGKINFINIRLPPAFHDDDLPSLQNAIERGHRGLKVLRIGEVARQNSGVLAAQAMSLATSSIALLVGALGVANTLLTGVIERARELGVLLAMGWSRSRIASLVLLESLILCLAGALVGIAGGVAGVRALENAAPLRGKIEGVFSPALLLAVLLAALILGALSALYPAWRAASLQPLKVLRTE